MFRAGGTHHDQFPVDQLAPPDVAHAEQLVGGDELGGGGGHFSVSICSHTLLNPFEPVRRIKVILAGTINNANEVSKIARMRLKDPVFSANTEINSVFSALKTDGARNNEIRVDLRAPTQLAPQRWERGGFTNDFNVSNRADDLEPHVCKSRS
jgi:hypothetical protein